MKIKITKKTVAGNGLYLAPSWISNGHWIVRRSCLENEALFASPETVKAAALGPAGMRVEEMSDQSIARIADRALEGRAEALTFEPTGWERAQRRGPNRAAYRSTRGGLLSLFNADYASALGNLGPFLVSPTSPSAMYILGEDGEVLALVMAMESPAPGEPWNEGVWMDTSDYTVAAAQIRNAKVTK